MEKIFVDKHETALFHCPHCGFTRQFDASVYKNKDSRIKIKCQCGETVPVLIEFRKFFRKDVELFGYGVVLSSANGSDELAASREKFPIVVRDLSMNGLSFSIGAGSGADLGEPRVGDVILLQFRLDNRSRDLIERKAEIQNVHGARFGVSFLRSEYDKELGFYLLR